ncbi:phagocyte signaling-impaired protein isoform X2 [Agrilus planipennis]|uniref:N-terminal acetyltransferase B complex subunit MDM20 homolog n=1 Tax=Agrilus planipennis TaxID=224129 RepID=A0A1W4XH84_AGRPL|nr:phagocyte signaling-impaired protein isoform X2 [Agrilus planipennis]
MASRAHVQDNSVVERRLRPVYDWLDTGNNKKALQECDKVLKKTPNLHCAKALKALALLRIGKESECTTLLNNLVAEKPSDDATLQAITLCYRELQHLDKICTLYQTAIQIDPSNEELHTHLFMSYVRISDFRMQQQSALNLYKLKPKNPYYCWAVMSVILQATRGQGKRDPQKKKVLLSLAERMMDKQKTEDKLEAEPEVQLYLIILELQEKYEEALAVLESPLGTMLTCSPPTMYKLPYLIKMKRWRGVNLFCKNILTESMDRWDVWKEYINSVFQLMSSKPHVNNHMDENIKTENSAGNGENEFYSVDDTPEKAHEFICSIVENGADNGYLLRGPYLARFELCSHLIKVGTDTTDLLGETMELFIEYFHKFGHKSCCVSDLKIYLQLLDSDKRSELATRLLRDVGISATSVPKSEHQMQRHICSLQISRLCGNQRNLSSDYLQAMVTALSLHYQHGYQTYGTNLLPTDPGPSDAYAILASHVLYDLAIAQNSSQPLVCALVLLENLLRNSPSNFNAKLLCVKFYHLLGCGAGAHHWYESLDIKHLQLDSLGYIHCSQLYSRGMFTLAAGLYDTTLKFFTSNYKDSSDHLTFSYKFGSFIKLEEFMDFRERLNNSLHYVTTAVDKIILSLVQCSSIENLYSIDLVPKDNKIEWEELRDNRDVSVHLSWDPERIEGSMEDNLDMKLLVEQDMALLRLRFLLVRSFSISLDIVKSSDGVRSKHVEDLRDVLKDWKNTHSKVAEKHYKMFETICVAYPLPSHLHAYLELPFSECLIRVFDLFCAVATEVFTDDISALSKDVCTSLSRLVDNISRTIKVQNESKDCLWNAANVLEQVVNTVEVFSLTTLVCLLAHDLLKLPQGSKKSKKKVDSAFRDRLQEVAVHKKQQMQKIEESLDAWNYLGEFSDNLTDRLAALNLNVNGQDSVKEQLKSSHEIALKEIRIVLRSKVKLLSASFNS